MTRRGSKSQKRITGAFRELRIRKLIACGWIREESDVPDDALPVDPDLINLGGSYHRPIFFSDQSFTCQDCGISCVWKAEDQRWYFEVIQAPFYETAVRCRGCRQKERERKELARVRAGHAKTRED